MKINLKFLSGKIVTFDVEEKNTVKSVKQKLKKSDGICVDTQRIIFEGKQLEDNITLAEYKITDNSTLHVIIRLAGC